MGRVEGLVALITGAARGQGRSHAIRLAREGANIVALDVCADSATSPYGMATQSDLEETEGLVREAGAEAISMIADVRSQADLDAAVAAAIDKFGRLDIVVANAGMVSYGRAWELTEEQWQDVVGVNLTGVWHTIKAVVPAMIAADNGGSIIIISSTGGLKGVPGAAHYVAAKHGVVGLMRSLANEVAKYWIRVNTIHPTGVPTTLILNDTNYERFSRGGQQLTKDELASKLVRTNLLPVPWVEAEDVSNAVLWLASAEARYVTGITLPVDAGFLAKV